MTMALPKPLLELSQHPLVAPVPAERTKVPSHKSLLDAPVAAAMSGEEASKKHPPLLKPSPASNQGQEPDTAKVGVAYLHS